MTDPTLTVSTSSGRSETSNVQSSALPSPPSYPPSIAPSTSGGSSRPLTAPASPEHRQFVATVMTQQQPKPPSSPPASDLQTQQLDSVVLGLQQLERQQAEQEQKRMELPVSRTQPPVPHEDSSEADDDTAPSSTMNSNTNDHMEGAFKGDDRSSSIGRFLQNTRVRTAHTMASMLARHASDAGHDSHHSCFLFPQRRLSSRDLTASVNVNSEEPVIHPVYGNVPDVSEASQFGGRPLLIAGYLHKMGRNGKWQKRFFETDGENLTYYKTSERKKLLATLDLLNVGEITMVPAQDDCTFKICISDRDYFLRAESKSSCEDWVITLNRVKEARMHLGRVQLVRPEYEKDKAARVVLSANRERTKAVDGDGIHSWEDIVAAENAIRMQQQSDHIECTMTHATRLSGRTKQIQHQVVARWQKRQTSLQRLATRLLMWAKSVRVIKKSGCTDPEDQVVLDHHVHPPGHDDPPVRTTSLVGFLMIHRSILTFVSCYSRHSTVRWPRCDRDDN